MKGCSCETRDFTCGYHFYGFLREQGLSKEDARLLTSFELYGEDYVQDLGRSPYAAGEPRADRPASLH